MPRGLRAHPRAGVLHRCERCLAGACLATVAVTVAVAVAVAAIVALKTARARPHAMGGARAVDARGCAHLPCFISKGRASLGAPAPLGAIAHDVRTFHPGQVCSRCPRCSCPGTGRPRRSCSRCMRGGLAVWRTTRRTGRSSRSTRATCPGARPSSSATASRSQLKPEPEPEPEPGPGPEPEPGREPDRETRIPSLA